MSRATISSVLYATSKGIPRNDPRFKVAFHHTFRANMQVVNARATARRYGVENTLTAGEWKAILSDSNGVCCYCQNFVGVEHLELEHYYPVSKGGANSAHNIKAACRPCNLRKKDKIPNR